MPRSEDVPRRASPEAALLRPLPEAIGAPALLVSEKEIVSANRAAARLLGVDSRHQLIGSPIDGLFSPSSWSQVRRALEAVLSGTRAPARIVQVEVTPHGPDADPIRGIFQLTPIHPRRGEPRTALAVFAQDERSSLAASSPRAENVGREETDPSLAQAIATDVGPLIARARDVVTEVDANGSIVSVTPNIERELGFVPEDVIGRSIFDFVHPVDLDRVLHTFKATREGGQGAGASIAYRALDSRGAWRWLDTSARVFEAAGGRIHGVLITRDVTDRKRESDDLEEFFDLSEDLLAIYGDEGRIRRLNRAWKTQLGYDPEALVGRPCVELVHPEDAPAWLEAIDRGRREAMPVISLENRFRDVDGEWHWLSWRATVLPELGLSFAIARDVTEERRAAERLRIREERYRAAIEAGSDAFFIFDAECDEAGRAGTLRLVELNARAAHWLKVERTEALGRPLDELLAFADQLALKEKCLATFASGENLELDSAIRFRDQPSAYVHVEVRALSRGVAIAIRDISSRRQIEMELRQSQKMEALGRLAGGVAHDFNNLLTVINGYSDLLLDDEKSMDEIQLEAVREVRRAGDRAAELTSQLLAFGRRQVFSPEILDLRTILHGMEGMLARLIGEHIDLVTLAAPDTASVRADRGQLEQLIMNLVVNARDAMPAGGRLEIAIENRRVEDPSERRSRSRRVASDAASDRDRVTPGDWVLIRITDTGSGMDAPTLEHLFEPFFTTKPVGRGTGLGLSMVHGIVRQSGGEILVDSRPGEGSTFRIYLPRSTHTPAVEHAHEPSVSARGRSERVLLVEDEIQIRRLARRVLERAGFEVIAAEHGEEALALADADEGGIDVLVTDVVMPRMSGPDLVSRLMRDRPDLRVLYMSGYSEQELVGWADKSGVHLLRKPFRPAEVVEAVRATLDAPRPPASGCEARQA